MSKAEIKLWGLLALAVVVITLLADALYCAAI